jgi:hypothetical protein
MVIIRDLKVLNLVLWISGDEGYYLRDKVFGETSSWLDTTRCILT